MGKNHFPPPESSPRSNKPPRRLAPGSQRVEAKPLNHFNSPPNNKPTTRPPPDRFHGNHLNKTTADYRRHHPRDSNRYGQDHHVPIKYDQRDSVRKDPSSSEVRFKLPENFYTKEGPSFLDVMKKPVPVAVIPNKIRTNAPSEFNRHVDQVVRKPIADAEFNRSTAAQNQFLNLNPNTYSRDRPDLPVANDSNLDLDQDLNQINRKIPEELPIMKESTGKENAWKSGSFVDVLKKPAPITLPQINDSVMVGTGISPMEKAAPATNAQSRNGYQNQTPRYYKRRDRGRRTVNLEKKHNRNRKAHHSRGEEILLDDSKKKIRTPEKVELPPADLPKSSDFIVGNVAILIRKYSNLL